MKFNLLIFILFAQIALAGLNAVFAQTHPTETKLVSFHPQAIPDTYFDDNLNTAKLLISNNETDKASEIIKSSIKNTTKRSPLQKAYILEGLLNFSSNKFAEAAVSYNNYLKLHAANSDVLFLKAQALIKSAKHDDALSCLNEALWFNKFIFISPADVNLQISNIYLSLDNKVKAGEFLQKALAVRADNVNVLNQLAELELEAGKKPEAIARLRTALTADAQNEDSKLLLTKALLTKVNRENNQKDVIEAKSISKEVLDKTADNQKAQLAAGLYIRATIEESKFDEAANLIEQYMKKYPQNSELQALNQQLKIEVEGLKQAETEKSKLN